MRSGFLASVLIFCLVQMQALQGAQSARYRVTFEADWSSDTHPIDFPAGAHFSGLIGATHGSDTVIWRSGGLASDGIEAMAETGSKSFLLSEINNLIAADAAETVLSGGGIAASPGLVSLDFTISRHKPLVTLVSMIAPSPDWFVGVDSLPLRADGAWLEQLSVQLLPYDAGTDSGESYTAPDFDTQPAQAITPITGVPFDADVPLGRFVFELLSTSGDLPLEGSLSGLYHDPLRVGEGINLLISQIGERHFVFLTWYTYNTGAAMWLVGIVDFIPGETEVTLDLLRADGTGFGSMFDPAEVELIPWGTIDLSFPACGLVNASYASTEPGFGSDTIQLEQLVGVAGTLCP